MPGAIPCVVAVTPALMPSVHFFGLKRTIFVSGYIVRLSSRGS